MKWLVFIGVMTGLVLWWKSLQQKKTRASTAPPAKSSFSSTQLMLQCPYCGLRFTQQPHDSRFGSYCCAEHQTSFDSKGWWGKAQWLQSPNYDERPDGMPIELVLIHHISLPPGEFGKNYVADFFQNKLNPKEHPYFQEIVGTEVSSHFFIRRDGQVQQFVSVLQRAWHAGTSNFFGRERCNDFSIGIELEGTGDIPFMPSQYQSLAELVTQLKKQYPIVAFAGHSDVAPDRKTDPGQHFDWNLFAQLAQIPEQQFPYGMQKR